MNFCEMVEDFCGKAEVPDDLEGSDGFSLPLADIKALVNEITLVHSKKFLHSIPLDTLTRLINVLDRLIQCAQGVSIEGNENVSHICYRYAVLNAELFSYIITCLSMLMFI